MKNQSLFFTVIIAALLLISCEKDFELNAEWEDITVVYSIFNQNDTEHFIKINRAFTTGSDGNANHIALIPDSLYYDTTNLVVKVIEYENGVEKGQYNANPVVLYNKDNGTFFSDWQILYKFNADLNEDNIYQLQIENVKRNKFIESETNLVNDFYIDKPNAGGSASFVSINPVDIKWTSAKNGKRYQITIRFHYKEKSIASDTIERYSDWVFSPVTSIDTKAGREMKIQYTGKAFYDNLDATVPYDDPVKEDSVLGRVNGLVDFIFTVANDELNTYLDVTEPNNSIVEDRPTYSNIENGIGIFCSRYNKVRTKPLSAPSIEELRERSLKFK